MPEDCEFVSSARYLITLDADTTLPIGAAHRLITAMLHPSAHPIIEDGHVVRGHGIIQPRMVTTTRSASVTPFAVMCSGGGGADTYASAGYDTFQSIYDEGNFCGKGIIDIDTYNELLCDRFPEETVLSHDLLEGIILRSAIDGECRFSDSTPKNPVSFMTRAHRWIRGDVQAWLWGRREDMDALSHFKLLDNVRHALTPLASLILVILSAFMGGAAAMLIVPLALSYAILPFIITLLGRMASLPSALAHGGAVTVRSGRIRGAVMLELRRMIYSVCTLAYQAARAGDAAVRALWRTLVSHRRMLEWTTAAEGDRYSGQLTDYTVRMMPSVLLGVAFYAHRLGNAAAVWTYDVHRTDACMAARYAVRQAQRCSEHRRASTAADLRCGYLAILCGHRNGRGKLSAAGQYIVSARGTCCRPYLSDKYRTVSYVGHCRAGSRTYRNSRDRAQTACDRRHSRAPREMARTSLQLVLGQHSIGAFAVCFRRRQRKFRRIAYGGVFSA